MSARPILRGLLFCSGVFITYAGIAGLGYGPAAGLAGEPPFWATGLLITMIVLSGFFTLIVGVRGFTPPLPAISLGIGTFVLLAMLVFATFSVHASPPVSLQLAGVVGLLVAVVGISTIDARETWEWAMSRPWSLVVILAVIAGLEYRWSAPTTAGWLLPLLWAHGAGLILSLLVVLAGGRWISEAGIHIDSRLGVHRSSLTNRYQWDAQRMVTADEPSLVRMVAIITGTTGLLLVLLAPIVGGAFAQSSPILLPCTQPAWAHLTYDVVWAELQFSWADGCRTYTTVVARGPVVVGTVALVLAVGYDRLIVTRQSD